MAEILRGFVCRLKKTGHLCGFRKADGQPNEWHTWTDRTAAEQHTEDLGEILPAVQYVGQDAPMWRERPTCPGLWTTGKLVAGVGMGAIFEVTAERLAHDLPFVCGPWFGPLPEIPQELRT